MHRSTDHWWDHDKRLEITSQPDIQTWPWVWHVCPGATKMILTSTFSLGGCHERVLGIFIHLGIQMSTADVDGGLNFSLFFPLFIPPIMFVHLARDWQWQRWDDSAPFSWALGTMMNSSHSAVDLKWTLVRSCGVNSHQHRSRPPKKQKKKHSTEKMSFYSASLLSICLFFYF